MKEHTIYIILVKHLPIILNQIYALHFFVK